MKGWITPDGEIIELLGPTHAMDLFEYPERYEGKPGVDSRELVQAREETSIGDDDRLWDIQQELLLHDWIRITDDDFYSFNHAPNPPGIGDYLEVSGRWTNRRKDMIWDWAKKQQPGRKVRVVFRNETMYQGTAGDLVKNYFQESFRSLVESDSWDNRCWIAPDGAVIPVDWGHEGDAYDYPGDYLPHDPGLASVMKKADAFFDQAVETGDASSGYDFILEEMLKRGWLRVTSDVGSQITIQVGKLTRKAKENLWSWAKTVPKVVKVEIDVDGRAFKVTTAGEIFAGVLEESTFRALIEARLQEKLDAFEYWISPETGKGIGFDRNHEVGLFFRHFHDPNDDLVGDDGYDSDELPARLGWVNVIPKRDGSVSAYAKKITRKEKVLLRNFLMQHGFTGKIFLGLSGYHPTTGAPHPAASEISWDDLYE